ncbi:type I toxin-antitoxin system ptaRNA1 family toxin [Teredinibacter turnerae]
MEFIDQKTARHISPVAEAVANIFTILYYQAETGRATPDDFEQR